MPDAPLIPLRTALLSASDKTGLPEFARRLADRGVRLISTGGTARALRDAGLEVTPVEQITGFPEMMDGRVKTLHPKIHGGLLALRDNPDHAAALKQHDITPIDLVCVNLYPFEAAVAKPGVAYAEAVENIDIGGPCMIRAAAKNHRFVACLTSPDQYTEVLSDLDSHDGHTRYATRQRLAAAAYAAAAEYDAAIATWLTDQL